MTTSKKYPYGLAIAISPSHTADPDDVMLVKRLLSESGHYEVPDFGMTTYPDTGMFEGIKSFQKENNLRIDGVIKPDGPTIKAMASLAYYICTNCGAPHGGVYSTKLCHFCYNKLS